MKGLVLILSSIFVLAVTSGCKTYSTISIPADNSDIGSLYLNRPHISLHDKTENNLYWLNEMRVLKDSINGHVTLQTPGKMHKLHKKKFLRSKSFETDPLKTIHLYTTVDSFEIGSIGLSLHDISTVEYHEIDHGATAGRTIGTVLGTVAVVGGVTLAIVCNCPEVTSLNDDDSITHGSLFPGSILKSLERTDYLPLSSPLYKGDDYLTLKVSNTRAEEQFIDELRVLSIQHAPHSHIGISHDGLLTVWDQDFPPQRAMANSITALDAISRRDGVNFDFANSDTTTNLVSIELDFNRHELIDHPALIIQGKQSTWLDTVAQYVFYKAGKGLEKWIDRNDNRNPKKFKTRSVRRGMSLNVYIQKNNKWEYVGSFADVGTSSHRKMAMPIDLSEVKVENVQIKLESAFKIWELDFAGISNEWTQDMTIDTLPVISARNQDGADLLKTIAYADDKYAVQSEVGDYIELNFKAKTSDTSTFILKGRGYYHHFTGYSHKGDLKFFHSFRRKDGLHNLSIEMDDYIKTKYRSTAETILSNANVD